MANYYHSPDYTCNDHQPPNNITNSGKRAKHFRACNNLFVFDLLRFRLYAYFFLSWLHEFTN